MPRLIIRSPDQTKAVDSDTTHGRYLVVIALFALLPLANFTNHNREQLDRAGLEHIALAFVTAFTTAAIGFFFLDKVLQRRRTGAMAGTIVFLWLFFNYHSLYDTIVSVFSAVGLPRGENYAYLGIVVVACSLVVRLAHGRAVVDFLLAFGVIANLIPLMSLLSFLLSAAETQPQGNDNDALTFHLTDRPNVYHIIADAYARQDTLIRELGFDNGEFLEALEARDFYVARRSHSNYPSTFLSLSATLMMNYPVTDQTVPFERRTRFYEAIQGNNPVVRTFESHGYRYAHMGSAAGVGSSCPPDADLCLSTRRAVQQALLGLTPLRRFLRRTGPSVPSDIEAYLGEILSSKPVYLFAHTFAPHPPRTFTPDCVEVSALGARDDRPRATSFWGDREGYLTDLKCTNKELVGLIDAILGRDPTAVILIQGDHGTAFGVDWTLPIDQWPDPQIEERFPILMALRLPQSCRSSLYPSISPVNLYRVVFGCLGDAKPELVPDRLYVSPMEKHAQYGTAHRYPEFELSTMDTGTQP